MTPQARSALTAAALLVAASGAGLYAYYGVKRPEEAAEARKATDEALFTPPKQSVPDGGDEGDPAFTQLTVEAKGDHSQLEKHGDSWFLVQPLEAKAEGFTVEAILGQLQTAKIKREVEAQPSEEELVRFGLKPPRFTVTAKSQQPGKPREVTLFGGIENSFDGSVYLQRQGDPKVYAADGLLRQTVEKSNFDLRNKEVFALDDDAIRKVTVKVGPRTYSLERASQEKDGGWRLTSPSAEPADTATVTGILSSFRGQRALSFPAPTPALEKAFTKARAEVTVHLSEGDPLTFKFISTQPDGKGFVLRQQGTHKLLAEVSPEAAKPWDRDPSDLKDRSVTGVKAATVNRLAIKPAGSDPAVVVERTATADGGTKDEWSVIAPSRQPAAKLKLSSILWSLESLKASAVLEAKVKDLTKYGFGPAAHSISLYGVDGKNLARLEIGKEIPGKAGMFYVRGSRGQALEVDGTKLEALPKKLADVLVDSPPSATDAVTPTQTD